MEECFETSAYKIQAPGNNLEAYNSFFLIVRLTKYMHSNMQRYTTIRHFFVFAQSSQDVSISSIIFRGLTLLTLRTQVLRTVAVF